MEPFLKKLADHFITKHRGELHNYRFFMPNRRAGIFFMHYLSKKLASGRETIFAPQITTLNDFVASMTNLVIDEDLPIIFEMFKIYREMRQEDGSLKDKNDLSFETFYPIGELLLNDFNDIDKHLVDAEKILQTALEFKEIDKEFEADEVGDLIAKLRNTALLRYKHYDPLMTKETDNNEAAERKELKQTFLIFWHRLYPLYEKLKNQLLADGRAYEGLVLRHFIEDNVQLFSQKEEVYINVFIGMNALTPCEEKILNVFKLHTNSLFYWDYDLPLLRDNISGYFIGRNRDHFPEPEGNDHIDFGTTNYPSIKVVSIPSAVAQTRYLGHELKKLAGGETEKKVFEELQAVVVLPDEHILMPMLSNIPEEIHDINITMGYPLKDTPAIAMCELLVKMLQRTTMRKDKEVAWPGKDLLNLLSTRSLFNHFKDVIEKIKETIFDNRLYNITTQELEQIINAHDIADERKETMSHLLNLLLPKDGINNVDDKGSFLMTTIITLVETLLQLEKKEVVEPEDNPEGFRTEEEEVLQLSMASVAYPRLLALLYTLQEQLATIKASEGSLDMLLVVELLRTLFRNTRIPFVGEPLKGLQIMGFLETRSLDFSYIFIPDVAEGILPAKRRVVGIIPYYLRLAHGLPNYEWQDRTRAYHFFRLISRAKSVVFTYDARRTQSSEGEPSRYIRMLQYLFPKVQISFTTAHYPLRTLTQPSADKDLIHEKIEAYRLELANPESKCALSASNINSFIQCPRRFYYTAICGMDEQDELDELMDDAELGTVIHKSLQLLYEDYKGQLLESNVLEDLLKQKDWIDRLVRKTYKEEIHKNKEIKTKGLDQIRLAIALNMVLNVIKKDKKVLDANHKIKYIQGEKLFNQLIELKNGSKLKIKGFIDRLDLMDDTTLRVIDFKTGKDTYSFDLRKLDRLPLAQFNHAAVQLLFYCWAIKTQKVQPNQATGNVHIQPIINKPLDMDNTGKLIYSESGKKVQLQDYDTLHDEYDKQIDAIMSEIIRPDQRYPANPGMHCNYCPAKGICLAKQYSDSE